MARDHMLPAEILAKRFGIAVEVIQHAALAGAVRYERRGRAQDVVRYHVGDTRRLAETRAAKAAG